YTYNTSATATANITARTLTVTPGGVNKIYDGTTSATVTTSDNRIAGDVFTVSDTAAFPDKNVGPGKVVAVSGISISGTDAANYTPASTTGSAAADITPHLLTIAATGINRVYDGTTSDAVSLS